MPGRLFSRWKWGSRRDGRARGGPKPPAGKGGRTGLVAIPDRALSTSLGENRGAITQALGQSTDLVFRDLRLGPAGPDALLVCFAGLVDASLVGQAVIEALAAAEIESIAPRDPAKLLETLRQRHLATTEVTEVGSLQPLLHRLGDGDCALLVDGSAVALTVYVAKWRERRIDEALSESMIRGPRDAFIETLGANVGTIRRRIKHPNLRLEGLVLGRATMTDAVIAYILGVAREGTVREVRRRLERIDIDSILESGYVEEFIEDEPLSPFPQTLRTERPDRVAAALLEGRVAVLVDGTPFALITPATLTMFLTTPEDYYERPLVGALLRLLRYAAFTISLTLPSLYVAITTFHQEMLPTPLVLSIAAQRRGVPAPAAIEAFLLEVAFELFREAGLRLPRIIGPAVTIAGTLVIGESAARAGLVSPIMVVAVALTGISSFAIPAYSMSLSVRLIRFPLLFLASSMGVFGVVFGLSVLLIHLCSLRSLGVPYLSPLAPLVPQDLKDSLIRVPWWAMRLRPHLVAAERTRGAPGRRPRSPRPRPPKAGRT